MPREMFAEMVHVREAARLVAARFRGELIVAVETGTIRSAAEPHHWSTLAVARELGKRGHLTSVDTNQGSINVSRGVCGAHGAFNVAWVRSTGADYLRGLSPGTRVHLALLDSANDPDVILEEYTLLRPHVPPGGIVVVDDAGILRDGSGVDPRAPGRKGHGVWCWLRARGTPPEVRRVEHCTQLWIEART